MCGCGCVPHSPLTFISYFIYVQWIHSIKNILPTLRLPIRKPTQIDVFRYSTILVQQRFLHPVVFLFFFRIQSNLLCLISNVSMVNAVIRWNQRCSTYRSQDSWPNGDWNDRVVDLDSIGCNYAFRCRWRYYSSPTDLIVMYCWIYSIAYSLCRSANVVDLTIDFWNVDQIQISESIDGGEWRSDDTIDWIYNGTQSPEWEEIKFYELDGYVKKCEIFLYMR